MFNIRRFNFKGGFKMKKLLVLVLVLGLASLAGAAIVSPMDLVANEALDTFSIVLTGNTNANGMDSVIDGQGGYWILLGVDTDSGAINLAHSAMLEILEKSAIYGDVGDTGLFGAGSGVYGAFYTLTMGAWTAETGTYANGFTLQEGATEVSLYAVDDAGTLATLVETIIIPEPATIALLCLGGLLLRKKK